MILNSKNRSEAKKYFEQVIDMGLDFKLQDKVTPKHLSIKEGKKLLIDFPENGVSIDDILKEFSEKVLPYCTNFSSPNFMGFPDAGNSVAAISAGLLYNMLQQNLINQSFCGPSATFVEIAVIKWLREVVGYKNGEINDIWDVGGIITPGGTSSNTIGIILARENRFPDAMNKGVEDLDKAWLVVPKGIGHYSVKSGQMWAGCGNRLIEVETKDFRYDLDELKKTLEINKGKVMCVVAYAGDSRTMTVDNFTKVVKIVKAVDPTIWLHADACHGFSLGFSPKLKHKIKGIELFDSITMDPHKVMMTPYVISVLLVKNPQKFKTITSMSDLIMQEQFAFGQITPFLGSRPWLSLKLWFVMKNLGKKGFAQLIERRHKLAQYLASKLERDSDFILLNKVEINSVAFMYRKGIDLQDIERLNKVNKKIHNDIIEEGLYHLHQFSVPDSGKLKKGEIVYPQRYMAGNPNISEVDIDKMLEYVRRIGENAVKEP
ncbi:MAG: pyridoxal-dependent decarboxylase [Candidatus Daviesbacteria bacterium]|nr:MAG: pyridoxal-dependent decarboxylase [Candidatus Daviesbacteria bacterium]